MTTLAERFQAARVAAELNKSEAALAIGISPSAVSQIENGSTKTLEGKTLMAAARVFKVNPVWLNSGRGARKMALEDDAIVEENPDYPPIRRVRLKLAAGISGYSIEYENPVDGPPMYFHKSWYARHGYDPKMLLAFKASGRSMEPGIADGDPLVANTASQQPKDGIVFALNYEGELAVKRLVKLGDEWIAASDNADKARYRDKPMTASVTIIGEIVHKQSERI